MTFSTNVPNANQSPGLFPTQMNTDLIRLKANIEGNHQFNDTLGVPNTDGFHNRVDYINPAIIPTIPAGADATGYSFLTALGTGTNRTEVYARTTQGPMLTSGCRASVVFTGRAGVGAATMHSAYNVTGVANVATGVYDITFSFNMANANYATVTSSQVGSLSCCSSAPPDNTVAKARVNILNSNNTASDGAGIRFHVLIFGG